MSVIFKVGGKVLLFIWRNHKWLVPATIEGYKMVRRLIKINKLKRAKK